MADIDISVWQNIGVIIPALNPDNRLMQLIIDLKNMRAQHIVLVNDGSKTECDSFFSKAEQMGIEVLHHAANLGKGRALKTAFNHLLLTKPQLIGTVTADADGQHLPKDIAACAVALYENPEKFILGCRNFRQDHVPFINKTGNIITCHVMRFLCGVNVSDTQTGLRAVPHSFMPHLLKTPGERFEYETNMLLETKEQDIKIHEVPIETVYQEEGYSTHFNPILDAARIYFIFFKYVLTSLSSAVIDMALFAVFVPLLKSASLQSFLVIGVASVVARLISAICNFLFNRQVFHSKKKVVSSAIKYFFLAVCQLTCSILLVSFVYSIWPVSETLIKIGVDVALFFVSYKIQQRFIF